MLLRTRYYVAGQLEPGQPYYNCSAQCGKMPGCGFPNAEYATQQVRILQFIQIIRLIRFNSSYMYL